MLGAGCCHDYKATEEMQTPGRDATRWECLAVAGGEEVSTKGEATNGLPSTRKRARARLSTSSYSRSDRTRMNLKKAKGEKQIRLKAVAGANCSLPVMRADVNAITGIVLMLTSQLHTNTSKP